MDIFWSYPKDFTLYNYSFGWSAQAPLALWLRVNVALYVMLIRDHHFKYLIHNCKACDSNIAQSNGVLSKYSYNKMRWWNAYILMKIEIESWKVFVTMSLYIVIEFNKITWLQVPFSNLCWPTNFVLQWVCMLWHGESS